jgi:hypothetical protein
MPAWLGLPLHCALAVPLVRCLYKCRPANSLPLNLRLCTRPRLQLPARKPDTLGQTLLRLDWPCPMVVDVAAGATDAADGSGAIKGIGTAMLLAVSGANSRAWKGGVPAGPPVSAEQFTQFEAAPAAAAQQAGSGFGLLVLRKAWNPAALASSGATHTAARGGAAHRRPGPAGRTPRMCAGRRARC